MKVIPPTADEDTRISTRYHVLAEIVVVKFAQLAAALLRLHAERVVQSRREHRLTGRFLASHPGIAMLELPAQAEDIHDLDGLREIIARSA